NDGATATSGSSASFVDGPMNKVGDDAFTFPTGDVTKWARIGISDPGTDVTTTYKAEYFATAHTSSAVTGILDNVSIKEYWTLDQTVTVDDVQVKLYWEDDVFSGIDDCDVSAPDDLRVGHWNGSAWEVNVDGVNYTGTCAAGPDAGAVETNAVQPTYSPFTFSSKGSTKNPLGAVLPIQLLYFDAAYNSESKEVDLIWATVSETNNEFFTLERSINGHDFQKIIHQPGAGTSNILLEYEDVDQFPIEGLNYYRLKQTDYDGQFEYSDIIAVNVMAIEHLKLWPNPANDFVEISFGTEVMQSMQNNFTNCLVKIYNSQGQLLYDQYHGTGIAKLKIDVAELSSGLHIVAVTVEGQTFQVKFNK
ncbi:MAG: T9SS type A sorting domain-containing protein, partial [Flavobacteriales bacterium]|nr:T9SS type A sorting domain-containing protein [Flavobacteriales bacterium]